MTNLSLKTFLCSTFLVACALTGTAQAKELTLFGQRLDSASREALKDAAIHSGAELEGHDGEIDNFSAAKIGLPEAKTLQIVSLHGKVVMAQYTFTNGDQQDETLRKMLVAKYGRPTSTDDPFGDVRHFDGQYVNNAKYRWAFDHGMELVYSHEFFGDRYLTYLNKPQQALMQHALDAQSKNGAQKAATADKNIF